MSPPDPPELEALLADGAWLDGLAVRLAGHGPTAEDAVQETWLAAIRRGPAHGANPRGWLGTVLRNAVRKARRGEVHRTDRERAWGAGRPRSTSAEEAESLFALRHDLAEALKALDEEARRAILLRFVHDLTLREVAERLDLPLSTADRRIRTALGELRTRLDDGAEEAFDRRVLALLGLPASRTGPATGPRGGRSFDLAGLGWMGAVAAVGIALVLTSRSRLTAPEDPADVLREGGRGPQAESVVQVAGARARSAVTSRAMDPPAVGPRLDPAPGALQIEVGSPDGVPVAGVFVRPRPLHGGRRPPGRYTDASGRSTFDRLASGKYEVLFDRLGSRTHTVVAGRSDRLHVELRDRAVRGTVVDAAGRPVPGAVVWLSATSAGWLMGGRWQVASVDETEAARTDEHGRFEIASFGDAALLLARAPGRGSASALRLSRRRGSQEVEVRLPGSGGDLAGRVYGEDGSPAAAVEVTLEPPSDRDRPYPRRTTWTDDRGHFRFTGVAAGERLLHVDAVDHAPLSTRATVPGPDAEVRLGRGRDVRGRVLAEDGAPVVGAEVVASWGARGSARRALSDASGEFRLRAVPLDDLTLTASGPGPLGGTATAMLPRGTPEAVALRLAAPQRLHGVVRGEAGEPLRRCVILVGGGADASPVRAFTGPDGAFAAPVADAHPRRIRVLEHGAPVLETTGSAGAPLELVVPDAARPSATLHGLVVEPDGVPSEALRVELREIGGSGARVLRPKPEGGRFRTRPLPAGRFDVRVVGDRGEATLPGLHLVDGELLELGTIDLAPGAPVEIVLDGPLEGLAVELYGARGARLDRRSIDADAVDRPLEYTLVEGDYRLEARSAEGVPRSFPFTVAGTEPARFELRLLRGVRTEIRMRPSGERPVLAELDVVLVREGVRVFAGFVPPNWSRSGGGYVLAVGLEPGSYELRARLAGERARHRFRVEPGRSQVVDVVLR